MDSTAGDKEEVQICGSTDKHNGVVIKDQDLVAIGKGKINPKTWAWEER